jgi:hypothetical protein
LPIFTGVRGIGILRTSPFGDSTKLAKNSSFRARVAVSADLGGADHPALRERGRF